MLSVIFCGISGPKASTCGEAGITHKSSSTMRPPSRTRRRIPDGESTHVAASDANPAQARQEWVVHYLTAARACGIQSEPCLQLRYSSRSTVPLQKSLRRPRKFWPYRLESVRSRLLLSESKYDCVCP